MSKVDDVLAVIAETGYKPIEELTKDYNELLEKSKIAQPEASEEARQAYILNILQGRSQASTSNTLPLKGYFLGHGGVFDSNKKERDKAVKLGVVNEKGQLIYTNMSEKRKKFEGQPIPTPDESMSRVAWFIGTVNKEGVEENWKASQLWIRKKDLIPPTRKLVKFVGSGNFNVSVPSLNTVDTTQFVVLSEEKVNFGEMAKTILPTNICDFSDITTFEPPESYPLVIFRAQVVRTAVTKDVTKSNPVELRMVAETIDDILKADNVENITVWCDKAVPLDICEGDIVWAIVSKFKRQDGSISLNGQGFYIEKTGFPTNTPLPITEENAKMIEEEVKKPENWGG